MGIPEKTARYQTQKRSERVDRRKTKSSVFGQKCRLIRMKAVGHGGDVADRSDMEFMLFDGKYQSAHRIAWQLENGPIPDGLHVMHTCDVRTCVNAIHLRLGTNAENVQDRIQKGRRGGRIGTLTQEHRQAIYDTPDRPGVGSWLARHYGVDKRTISGIRAGRFAGCERNRRQTA